MRITVYILSFITFFFLILALLLTIQHWPGGIFLRFLSMLLMPLTFGLFLIHKYRSRRVGQQTDKQKESSDILDLNL